MMTIKTGTLLKDNTENPAILDSIEALRSAGFGGNIIAQFSQKAVNILNDYAELIGEGTEFRFGLTKGILSLKLTVRIPGKSYDPFKSGSSAKERTLENITSMNLSTQAVRVSHEYQFGTNVLTVIITIKTLKTSLTTKISISELWRKIWPAVMTALSTGSTSAAIHKSTEISENEFHIKPEFTSFWIPMGGAMLNPKTTVNVVIACFMAAHLTGMTVTTSFLAALILVTMELSIASPGTAAAWAIMLETLSMPTGYVGLFTIYRMFTVNFGAGCTEAYLFMEEVEAAHKMDAIRPQGEIAPAET